MSVNWKLLGSWKLTDKVKLVFFFSVAKSCHQGLIAKRDTFQAWNVFRVFRAWNLSRWLGAFCGFSGGVTNRPLHHLTLVFILTILLFFFSASMYWLFSCLASCATSYRAVITMASYREMKLRNDNVQLPHYYLCPLQFLPFITKA